MPELPEVETMVRDLRKRLLNRSVRGAEIYWDRIVGYPDVSAFTAGIHGQRIVNVTRRGKFALLALDDDSTLAVHRGMTGSLFLRESNAPEDRFVRARVHLDDDQELRFDDSRKFGRLFLHATKDAGFEPPWQRLGPEPLATPFEMNSFRRSLSRRSAAIKTVLLNQSVIAGVGNIYADEALFLAKIHPTAPAGSLTPGQIKRLCGAITEVLSSAIERRGTTFSSYRDLDGAEGSNQGRLNVFHRHGLPCFNCGAAVQRIVLGTRGTHFCPRCQRAKRIP